LITAIRHRWLQFRRTGGRGSVQIGAVTADKFQRGCQLWPTACQFRGGPETCFAENHEPSLLWSVLVPGRVPNACARLQGFHPRLVVQIPLHGAPQPFLDGTEGAAQLVAGLRVEVDGISGIMAGAVR